MDISINTFKGLAIMLSAIIVFMLVDGFFNIPFITIPLSTGAGFLVILLCKGMSREELNMFRASVILGAIFFLIGNIIVLQEREKYFSDPTAMYPITIGFFLAAIGVIVMLSSIPIIVFKDLKKFTLEKQFT